MTVFKAPRTEIEWSRRAIIAVRLGRACFLRTGAGDSPVVSARFPAPSSCCVILSIAFVWPFS